MSVVTINFDVTHSLFMFLFLCRLSLFDLGRAEQGTPML